MSARGQWNQSALVVVYSVTVKRTPERIQLKCMKELEVNQPQVERPCPSTKARNRVVGWECGT